MADPRIKVDYASRAGDMVTYYAEAQLGPDVTIAQLLTIKSACEAELVARFPQGELEESHVWALGPSPTPRLVVTTYIRFRDKGG